jgi:hypothetical protein
MSKTVRRKRGDHSRLHWNLLRIESESWYNEDGSWHYVSWWTDLKPDSKEYKKAVAIYHSDAGWTSCKEPGPMWYIRETAQVPYRRRAKNELHKFMRDADYEVMIESKPHREYWT